MADKVGLTYVKTDYAYLKGGLSMLIAHYREAVVREEKLFSDDVGNVELWRDLMREVGTLEKLRKKVDRWAEEGEA